MRRPIVYGGIWVPITHPTPRFSQIGDRFVADTERAGSQMVDNPTDWRLVCSDQSSGPAVGTQVMIKVEVDLHHKEIHT